MACVLLLLCLKFFQQELHDYPSVINALQKNGKKNSQASDPHPPTQNLCITKYHRVGQSFVLWLWIIVERRAVYATLIDEATAAGVPSDTDNNSIYGAREGLKSPKTFWRVATSV